mmetsp:Transcript_27235/g.78322  ORF Transcript_27235/g.78322 Transcript_27235/m.78322 type:complete len:354 (+) Transcript_27235:117-1178(+)
MGCGDGVSACAPGGGRKCAVALLQEFVQCSREFAAPQHRAILQWSYGQRMVSRTALQFRATVGFLFDCLPHHVAGGWQASKKLAQKDAAERALRFFVGKWGEQLLNDAEDTAAPSWNGCSDVRVLEHFSSSSRMCGGARPQWSHRFCRGECTAEVELRLMDVPHTFAGAAMASKEAAYADVARRVLWYLQCPGYEHAFEPDPRASAAAGKRIPEPPANWACSSSELDDLRKTERKTVLMRVQNRLQQKLAKSLRPGEGVWEWHYEYDEEDTQWPPLVRGTVRVPGLRREFMGAWARGQREAQVEAGLRLAEYLDSGEVSAEPSTSSGSVAGSDEGTERVVRWADIDIDDELSC